MLIDTHCHLTYEGLRENVPLVLQEAAAAGVTRFITIGTDVEDHGRVLAVLRTYRPVFAALGIHPHNAAKTEEGYEAFLENRIRNEPKVVAVGEMGLDYHYNFAPKLLQKGVFVNQLEMARRLGKPAVLHVREAHADALRVMEDFPDVRFVVHCFTGTPDEAEAWVKLGAYLGFTGIVTYKNAAEVAEACKRVPLDRLLLETDAPYLSPEPVRTTRPNVPAHVKHVATYVAALRGLSVEDLAKQTTENAVRLFGDGLLVA